MKSISFTEGNLRIVDRENIYEDVLDMYQAGDIVGEYPIVTRRSVEHRTRAIMALG